MEHVTREIIYLEDIAVERACLVAVGRFTIPATLQTNEMYAISLYLKDVREPVGITYKTKEERDEVYDYLIEHM